MKQYELKDDVFVIREYDRCPPFTSFLPGLAGADGIPVWAYYVNRGQGLCSFGIGNKDNAAMEFSPANLAYEDTARKGFRTFLRCNGSFWEPFSPLEQGEVHRDFQIHANRFSVEESNAESGLKTQAEYFTVPHEEYGALARRLSITNLLEQPVQIEGLDGMARVIPYGLKNSEFKEMANLLKSWTELRNLENSIPFYTLRGSTEDSAQVEEIRGGWFYAAFAENSPICPVYDPQAVFGEETGLSCPMVFRENGLNGVLNTPQNFENRIPCGLVPFRSELAPGETFELFTLIGFSESPAAVNARAAELCSREYFMKKREEADALTDRLTDDVDCHTAYPVFNRYIRQCYLDNFLRGGYPCNFRTADGNVPYYLYSRKHGDPERDYNFFSIAGEFYSQGNGNFRDVCQNRRNDIFFHPETGEHNIRLFFSLIQADGYNPLEVCGSTFSVKSGKEKELEALLRSMGKAQPMLRKICAGRFTPGQAVRAAKNETELPADFLENLLALCEENTEANFKEGYWSDHWMYTLDLLDGYRRIYPDKMAALLYGDTSYRFFESPVRFRPLRERCVNRNGEIRQYNAVVPDEKKKAAGFSQSGTHWLKTAQGEEYRTTLTAKLISLAVNKFICLDPQGMGIEMEGGKPGWNDAMNGLPGLFGSGMSETFSLRKLIGFLQSFCAEQPVLLHEELAKLVLSVQKSLEEMKSGELDEFHYWSRMVSLREIFRESIRFGLSGREEQIFAKTLSDLFSSMQNRVDDGIQKALVYGRKIIPTYFTYRVTEYETDKKTGEIEIKGFEAAPLPCFLEAPAKLFGWLSDEKEKQEAYRAVRASGLFDQKLNMYKTSEPIDSISMECGRIRAFTPGWLERESIFLHMEYKYLLALLKSGMYAEFFQDIPTMLIPFLPPEQYGRSTLENSSFLASSANPDPRVHGRGFVSRLSGSTTEALSMWILMFVGEKQFTLEEGELCFTLHPVLPAEFFDAKGIAECTIFSKCRLMYYNPQRKATFGEGAVKVTKIILPAGTVWQGGQIRGKAAEQLRNGEIFRIEVFLA